MPVRRFNSGSNVLRLQPIFRKVTNVKKSCPLCKPTSCPLESPRPL
jgi:hypothetical protein